MLEVNDVSPWHGLDHEGLNKWKEKWDGAEQGGQGKGEEAGIRVMHKGLRWLFHTGWRLSARGPPTSWSPHSHQTHCGLPLCPKLKDLPCPPVSWDLASDCVFNYISYQSFPEFMPLIHFGQLSIQQIPQVYSHFNNFSLILPSACNVLSLKSQTTPSLNYASRCSNAP